jgi:predicted MPP superfamily phosphohydrolase
VRACWSSRAGASVAAGALAALAWAWFEAGWLRRRRLEVPVDDLRSELVGLRIVHLSDLHLGIPSRGSRAVERGFEWAQGLAPDLVVVTGDLLSRPRAEARLRELLRRAGPCYAVLGNHDVEHSRDPFSRSGGLKDLSPARLLVDEAETLELRGRRVQLVGVDPRAYRAGRARPWLLADPAADLRILLCHYPTVLRRLPFDSFDLVLAGHMHDGQITLPLPRRKVLLAHPRAPYASGLYVRNGITMHVSPGLGTTFVPLRFYARPEATELVLQGVRR